MSSDEVTADMNAVAFDTLKLARTLREKGKLDPEQAEGFADAIAEVLQGDLATRSDLQAVRTELKAQIRETELRLEAKIESVKFDIIRWVVGSIGFQTLVAVGAAITLARMLKS
jgi:hypothetical protein